MGKKFKNNVWLLFICFFVVPFIISWLLVTELGFIFDYDYVDKFISVSGYIITLFSSALVFFLFRSFRPSDYKKSIVVEKYLEKEAITELIGALINIKSCIENNSTLHLYDSCETVNHVYKSLKKYENDVVLKAYTNQIKVIFGLINKHSLITIGLEKNIKSLEDISIPNKQTILTNVDYLSKELGRAISKRRDLNGR